MGNQAHPHSSNWMRFMEEFGYCDFTKEKTQAFSKEDIAQSAPTQPTEQAEPSGETEDASVEDLKDQETKEPSENANQD